MVKQLAHRLKCGGILQQLIRSTRAIGVQRKILSAKKSFITVSYTHLIKGILFPDLLKLLRRFLKTLQPLE